MSRPPLDPSGIVRNLEKRRFEWAIAPQDGAEAVLAFVNYIKASQKLYITHTEVPPVLEGRGIASAMMRHILEWIDAEGLYLVPLCPFMAGYLQRHPQWQRLIAEGYSV
jgi:predicted GNAT family acetyltransferase